MKKGPIAPPDPDPAIRLGELLACCRRQEMPWSDRAFERLTRLATRDLDAQEREQWRMVFASQRAIWHAAYTRELRVRRYLDRAS